MHILRIRFLLICIVLLSCKLFAQAPTETSSTERVKSLTIRPKSDWLLPPAIGLNSDDALEIRFDYTDLNIHYFYYKIIHCNANWKPSDLSEPECLDGFYNKPIDERKVSFKITTRSRSKS